MTISMTKKNKFSCSDLSARKQIFSTMEQEDDAEEDLKPKRSSGDQSSMLPEKFKMLGEFFDPFHDSIKLLKLKGSMTTFTKICCAIKHSTNRKFTHRHLAQLKFILPEVIHIEKIQTLDKQTSCMMANLRIELNADMVSVDGKKRKDTGQVNLKKLFQKRLLDFVRSHPGADDVPEGQLPEPFNCRKIDNGNRVALSGGELTREAAGILSAGGVSLSIRRHFSRQKCDDNGTKDLASGVASKDAVLRGDEPCLSESPFTDYCNSAADPSSFAGRTSQKEICYFNCESLNFASTPAKLVSTPARLLAATPASHTPKECSMSPDNDDSSRTTNKLVRRPSSTRSLIFKTPVKDLSGKDGAQESGSLSYDEDLSDVLQMGLLQLGEVRDTTISRAKRRQEILAGLPGLFNTIRCISKSCSRSDIMKKELVYQIVTSKLEMTDRREVEEQLDLLKDCSINKMSNPDDVRAKLADAK